MSSGDPITRAVQEDRQALRARMTAVQAVLRTARRGRAYLHDAPWYLIIGPPGAGKTTALLHAGLRFSLTAELGLDPLKPPAATRSCDWWFAGQAVLIDMPGRHSTRDADAAGWEDFLDLLKQTRPNRPLNGAIVVIPVTDIALAPEDERLAQAQAIRRQVEALHRRLGKRVPIHVLLTKADLIAGFSAFFADLDQIARARVWGVRLGAGRTADTFARGFQGLVRSLEERLFGRLLDEPDIERRALIAVFPSQVAALEPKLAGFLSAAFPADTLLSGVYLSSAIQEGWPFDPVGGTVKLVFGIGQRRPANLRPEPGRPFFLENLFRDVILADVAPAGPRRTAMRIAGFAAIALAFVSAASWLWHLHQTELQAIDATEAALRSYEQIAGTIKLAPVSDADMQRLLPLLDTARALRVPENDAAGFGLSQEAKLADGTQTLYRHALQYALLPRLLWQLETQMRESMQKPEALYDATRVYLMLGDPRLFDRSLVREWLALAWQGMYPSASFRDQLLQHLDTLLTAPLPPVTLDQALVSRARTAFANVSLAQRAYSRIRLSAEARQVAPWRPSDVLGPVGVALFTRSSGKPLTEGVPGLYTVEGFHHVLLPLLPKAAELAAGESWVAGQRVGIDADGPRMAVLQREIVGLYENDYAQAWDSMMADLNTTPLVSISRAAQDLYIIESPQSPLRAVLVSIARQLTLSIPPGPSRKPPQSGGDGVLPALPGSVAIAESASAPGQEIDQRYAALRALVATAGSPIDPVLRSLNDMQQQFARAAASATGASVLFTGADPALAVKAEALRQPQPLARWMMTLATSGANLRGEVRR
jgi:type VI secretion system protein ImpL